MNIYRALAGSALFLSLLIVPLGPEPGQLGADDNLAPPPDVEILTRGPVHEAFAQPSDLLPEPGQPVPGQPPAAIPEEPPAERPEGANVQWIEGYWAWDAQRNEFIWVSGVMRNAPPGRNWVPGHWVQTPEGYRWVPGFWAPEGQRDIPLTPEPPATLDNGPSLPPPDDNSYYVPGNWLWRDNRFAWRPGYYSPLRQGRVWVEPRYVWTPNGYLYIDGYSDYCLEDRGLICAPVAFNRPLWRDPLWCYRPNFVIRPFCLFDNLFYHRPSNCFYYGNYYGGAYARAGYQPWFNAAARHDPLYNYYRWQNRGNPNWGDNLRQGYADRGAGRVAAPPVNFAQQNQIVNNPNQGTFNNAKIVNRNALNVVAPLAQVQKQDQVKLVRLSQDQTNQQKVRLEQQRELVKVRQQFESAPKGKVAGGPKAVNQNTPRSLTLPGNNLGSEKGRVVQKLETPPTPKGINNPAVIASPNNPPQGGPKDRKFEAGTRGTDIPRNIVNPNNNFTPKVINAPPVNTNNPPQGTRGNDLPKNTFTPPALPKVINNNTPPAPKVINNNPVLTPRNVNPPMTPKVINNPPPTPKVINTPPPKVQNNNPQFTPRNVNPPLAPRINNNPPPAPKVFNNPPPKVQNNIPQPTPRSVNIAPPTKTFSQPTTPRNNPAPRSLNLQSNPSQQTFKSSSAPRQFSPPPSNPAPRITQPSRQSSPPTNRSSGGGGGNKGAGGGKKR